jgi:hypothetical protein
LLPDVTSRGRSPMLNNHGAEAVRQQPSCSDLTPRQARTTRRLYELTFRPR